MNSLKSPPFPFSQSNRVYSPGIGCNLALILIFLTGVGLLAFLLQPPAIQEALSPNSYLYLGGGLGGAGAVTITLLWVISQIMAWQENRVIRNLTTGADLLIVWQYSPDEWRQLAKLQAAYERQIYKWWHTLISALIVVGFFAYLILGSDVPGKAREAYLLIGIFMIIMALLTGIGTQIRQRLVSQQHEKSRGENPTPKLYISRKGIYHETEGYLLFGKLQEMRFCPMADYPVLAITAWIASRRGGYSYSLSIPIPRQYMGNAQQMIQQIDLSGAHKWGKKKKRGIV